MTGTIHCPRCESENASAQEFCQKCGYGLQQTNPQDASSGTSPLSLIGKVMGGKYEVRSLLGEGGFGAVYEVEQSLLGQSRRFALKLLHEQLSNDDHFRSRFVREASIAMELVHPNVIPVRDFGETEDGRLYFTMDYCRGESLKEAIAREGFLTLNRTISIVEQILDVLDIAHDRQIIHRDLKPENIFLEREQGDERVRVGDFGLARSMGDSDRSDLTRGGIIGTPRYMSPEQSKGQPLDARSDLYSLGVMFFEMISGDLPPRFDSSKGRSTPGAIGIELRELLPERVVVPQAVLEIISRSLAPRTTDRFHSASEFRDSLNRLPTFTPTYLEPQPSARRPLRVAAAVFGLLIFAAGGVALGVYDPFEFFREKAPAIGDRGDEPDVGESTDVVRAGPQPFALDSVEARGRPDEWIPYRDGDQLTFRVITFDEDGARVDDGARDGSPLEERLSIGAVRDGVWPVDDTWGVRRFWEFESSANQGTRFVEWFEQDVRTEEGNSEPTVRWPLLEWNADGELVSEWDGPAGSGYTAKVTRRDSMNRALEIVVEQKLEIGRAKDDSDRTLKEFRYERSRGLVELSSYRVVDSVKQKIQTRVRSD